MKPLRTLKQIVFASLFLSCTLDLNSQAPGYMGKKLSFGYGFHFNPALSAYALGSASKFLNKQHEFFLEYVVGKRVSLGASLKFYKSSYNNTRTINYGGGSTTGFEEERPSGSYAITGKSIALYSKFFKRKFVAPWGTYNTVGLTLITYNCVYNPDEMIVTGHRYVSGTGTTFITTNDFGPTERSYMYPDLLVGWGKSRIFKNFIVFDWGYNLNFLATSFTLMDMLDTSFGGTTYVSNYIEKTSHSRIRGINRFNIYAKIGLLF